MSDSPRSSKESLKLLGLPAARQDYDTTPLTATGTRYQETHRKVFHYTAFQDATEDLEQGRISTFLLQVL